MTTRFAAPLVAMVLLSGFQGTSTPDQEFGATIKTYFGMGLPSDWEAIEKLPNFKWAALPPTSLKNCLPNGDCFARQGTAVIGGRTFTVVATGARTMVVNILFRNMAAPLGESAVVAALKAAGLGADLARCPVKPGGTSWYRLKSATSSGFLSIQPAGPGRPNEGFIVSQGDELPQLQPNQLALYTEQCAPGAERKPVSTAKPQEVLAEVMVSLLAPAAGLALPEWTGLAALMPSATWSEGGPKKTDLTVKNDPNPMALTGSTSYGGRKFALLASGTAAQVKTLYFDEGGTHPKGEHMLGVVYEKGIAVQLVRCGPPYTESTNNWYRLTSAKTRPAMIRQSIHYDGNLVSDSYELRLDGTLPPRDPRDRDPGKGGC